MTPDEVVPENPEDERIQEAEQEHILTGRKYRLRYIWLDIIFFTLIYVAMDNIVFRVTETSIQEHPFVYWGTLIGSSFALYMATIRIILRELSISKEFLNIVGVYLDGTFDEISKVAYELQAKGSYTAETSKDNRGPIKLVYKLDDYGMKRLTCHRTGDV